MAPFFVFGIGYIIEVYGYGGQPGWVVLLLLAVLSASAFGLAPGVSHLLGYIRRR